MYVLCIVFNDIIGSVRSIDYHLKDRSIFDAKGQCVSGYNKSIIDQNYMESASTHKCSVLYAFSWDIHSNWDLFRLFTGLPVFLVCVCD